LKTRWGIIDFERVGGRVVAVSPARAFGLILSGVYLLAAAALIASDFTCDGLLFCGIGLPMAGLPWTVYVFESDTAWVVYPASAAGIVLNAAILYFSPVLLAAAFRSKPPPR
jgi:hypothetical protein